jgi:hypothetical protein
MLTMFALVFIGTYIARRRRQRRVATAPVAVDGARETP